MWRVFAAASRLVSRQILATTATNFQNVAPKLVANQGASRNFAIYLPHNPTKPGLLKDPRLLQIASKIETRGLIKFSYRRGKRLSVKAVTRRFYRLNWGGWIRTKCGRHKKLWKKSPNRKRRLRQHVLCNSTQSTLLDKMAGKYWTKPKYWVDDPYNPYHTREEFRYSSQKPKPFFPPEQ